MSLSRFSPLTVPLSVIKYWLSFSSIRNH